VKLAAISSKVEANQSSSEKWLCPRLKQEHRNFQYLLWKCQKFRQVHLKQLWQSYCSTSLLPRSRTCFSL